MLNGEGSGFRVERFWLRALSFKTSGLGFGFSLGSRVSGVFVA